MEIKEKSILAYPIQNALTRTMRKKAEEQGNINFMSLWAGQSVQLCKDLTAKELEAHWSMKCTRYPI
jgi:nitronate monooxygenase